MNTKGFIEKCKNDFAVQAMIETVNRRCNLNHVGKKSPLLFKDGSRFSYYEHNHIFTPLSLEDLKDRFNSDNLDSLEDKILLMLTANENYNTYHKNGRMQCYADARRSANDLYRLLLFYFPNEDIELIDVMRSIYYLAYEERSIRGHYCSTVKKMVFWSQGGSNDDGYFDNEAIEVFDSSKIGELGVKFDDWNKLYRKDKEYGDMLSVSV